MVVRIRSLDSPIFTPASLRERGIGAVVFDKDGTLIDSLGPWAEAERALALALAIRYVDAYGLASGAHGASACGKPNAEEAVVKAASAMLAAIGVSPDGYDASGLMATAPTERILRAMASALRASLATSWPSDDRLLPSDGAFGGAAREELERLYPKGVAANAAMPGAEGLLASLNGAGFPLALVTADDRPRTESTLASLGRLKRFSSIACGDDGGPAKPDPQAVLAFARRLRLGTDRIAVVGDSEPDERMGLAAGAGLIVMLTR